MDAICRREAYEGGPAELPYHCAIKIAIILQILQLLQKHEDILVILYK